MRKIIFALLIAAATYAQAQPVVRLHNYHYTSPQFVDDAINTGTLHSAGIDSIKIIHLTKLILADSFPNIHSLLIFKDDKLVYENYFAGKDQISGKNIGYINHTREDLHDCRSISKSVVSACVGIAIDQGLIKSVDDPIFNYLDHYKKFKNEQNSKITIRHLLTMTSGMKWNEQVSYANLKNSELRMNLSFNPIKYILKLPILFTPDTKWNYNGGNTELLAEIIESVSGMSIDKFAEKNLFTPLGIKKYTWLPLIVKHTMPAAFSGLRLTSRDMLKFTAGNYNQWNIVNNSHAALINYIIPATQ